MCSSDLFVPRGGRRPVQLVLVLGSIIAALVVVVDLRGTRLVTGEGAIAIDGPALIIQGTLLVVALLSALLFAERSLDPLGDAFAPRASTLPGSDDEQQFAKRGYLQTEIWPLLLFSLFGMLLFGESLGWDTLLGMALIVGAGVAATRWRPAQ